MTQVKSVHRGRMARAVVGMDVIPSQRRPARSLTSEEKRIARRMARDPRCTYADIHAALKWTQTVGTLTLKLKAINIHCMRKGDVSVTNFLRYTYETRR